MKLLSILITLFAFTAFAADVAGTWKGTADFGGNTIERTFVFKVEGSKLTGETTSQTMGKSTITDGKVDGDNLTFSITGKIQDNEMKINYQGKVSGDTLNLEVKVEGAGDQKVVFNCKRVS